MTNLIERGLLAALSLSASVQASDVAMSIGVCLFAAVATMSILSSATQGERSHRQMFLVLPAAAIAIVAATFAPPLATSCPMLFITSSIALALWARGRNHPSYRTRRNS